MKTNLVDIGLKDAEGNPAPVWDGVTSERATSEPQAQSGRCAGATGSLLVSSAEALLVRWEAAAASYRKGGEISNAVANVFEICASDLRREMASATERQPEENAAYEPAVEAPAKNHNT